MVGRITVQYSAETSRVGGGLAALRADLRIGDLEAVGYPRASQIDNHSSVVYLFTR